MGAVEVSGMVGVEVVAFFGPEAVDDEPQEGQDETRNEPGPHIRVNSIRA